MRLGWLLPMIGLTMAVSTAGVHAQVTRGNDTGGIIPWSCENEALAKQIATDHCAWYDKYPRITGVDRQPGNYISFNCLWNPQIARYQLPAVRVRSTCVITRQPRVVKALN